MEWFEPRGERGGSRHVQVFLPSVDRDEHPIPEGQVGIFIDGEYRGFRTFDTEYPTTEKED